MINLETGLMLGFVGGDWVYKSLFAMHIGAIVASFGPTLAYPMLSRKATERPGEAGIALASISPKLNRAISLPGLVVAALSGTSLILQSNETYSFDKPWVSASFTIVLFLALISWFVLAPALARVQRAVELSADEGERDRRSACASVAMVTGLFHLGLISLLILMVWKPGQF